jgi:hypothetical protein
MMTMIGLSGVCIEKPRAMMSLSAYRSDRLGIDESQIVDVESARNICSTSRRSPCIIPCSPCAAVLNPRPRTRAQVAVAEEHRPYARHGLRFST